MAHGVNVAIGHKKDADWLFDVMHALIHRFEQCWLDALHLLNATSDS